MSATKNKGQLEVNYVLTNAEKEHLVDVFLQIQPNPYREYEAFQKAVQELAETDEGTRQFVEALRRHQNEDLVEKPFFVIQNCPYDQNVPVFDHEDPVNSKHKVKTTFIAEAFLELYAYIMNQPAIGYINVNNGDVFQDIYPQASLAHTQSQKAMVPLGFHKDLANHFVRPDFVNMLAMRSCEENQIFTTFVRNIDILNSMTEQELELMRQELFYTPFDDLSVYGNNKELGRAKNHAILLSEYDLAYFENRTEGLTEEAQQVVDKIKVLLHELKTSHLMKPGEFIGVANNYSMHGKDVLHIGNVEEQKIRWTIKTVNVHDLQQHAHHFVEGTSCIVNG